MKCCLHLPGNHQCPYPALYQVVHTPHRLSGSPFEERRLVCISHLAPAIDEALSDSARGAHVEVKLVER